MSLPATLDLEGPHVLSWTAATDAPWLQVAPGSGAMATRPSVSVATGSLSAGWQQGHITFTASSANGLYFTEQVPVNAFYGPVERVYLPLVTR